MTDTMRSTPIQNLANPTLNDGDEPNLSTAQGVLQKYKELEHEMHVPARGDQPQTYQQQPQPGRVPDQGDADTDRAQLNKTMEDRQIDSDLAKQHRMMEMQRVQQAQQQAQQAQYQMRQQQAPPMRRPGLMDRVKGVFANFRRNVKSLVIVVALFLLLSVGPLNALLLKFMPFLGDGNGGPSFKFMLFKAVLAGFLYVLLSSVLPF